MDRLEESLGQIERAGNRRPIVETLIAGKYPIWSHETYERGERVVPEGEIDFYTFNRGKPSSSHDVYAFLTQKNQEIGVLIDEDPNLAKDLIVSYLDITRALGHVDTRLWPTIQGHPEKTKSGIEAPNLKIVGPLSEMLTPDQSNEYLLTSFVGNQWNGRGVPSVQWNGRNFVGYTTPEQFREVYEQFNSDKFGLDENLLFTMVACYNIGDEMPGVVDVVPLLFDPRLNETYPEDMKKLGKLFLRTMDRRITRSGLGPDQKDPRDSHRIKEIISRYLEAQTE
jgi:hypothetical protein